MPASVGRKLLAAVVVPLGAAAFSAPAFGGGNAGFGPVNPESPNAVRVSHAYWLIGAFSLLVLLLITVPLLVFVVRYRSRGRPRSVDGPQVHGNTSFELAWTAVPVLILVVVAGFVFYKLPGITDPAAAGEPVRVRVEGRQFYWRYVYANGVVAIDTLRVPVGQVVKLDLTAPEGDVIHSYWIPALFGKRDTIPGGRTELSFVAKRPGSYAGQCGEFCGVQHAAMLARVDAVPRQAFEQWLGGQAAAQRGTARALGAQLWTGVCQKCHRLAQEFVGPPLGGNTILRDRQALAQVVRNGRGAMPAVGQGWTERELRALFDYTRRLGSGGGEGADGG